jgi:hypothetical protein
MPLYDYHCEENGRTVEVSHPTSANLRIWGEVCFVTGIPLGDTDPLAPVRRVLTRAPGVHVPAGDSKLKELGFAKLVRREDGVWEHVTAADGEARYLRRGDPGSLPRLHRRIRD